MSVVVTLASASVLVNIRAEMSNHETMTVKLHKTNETHHLMAYESERIRNALTSLSEGACVPVKMVCTDLHSNVRKVVALHGRQAFPAGQSARMAN